LANLKEEMNKNQMDIEFNNLILQKKMIDSAWGRTKSIWNDSRKNKFEKEFWNDIEKILPKLLKEIEDFIKLLEKAEREI
jgi:hypothetical protein